MKFIEIKRGQSNVMINVDSIATFSPYYDSLENITHYDKTELITITGIKILINISFLELADKIGAIDYIDELKKS